MTPPTPPTTLPKLTDHPPFAPIAARMAHLDRARRDAREARLFAAQACGVDGRMVPAHEQGMVAETRLARAAAAEEAAAVAQAAYRTAHYLPAYQAAVAACRPGVVATVWAPAVRQAVAAVAAAEAAFAHLAEVRDGLEAGGFALPGGWHLPAGLLAAPGSDLDRFLFHARQVIDGTAA